MIIIRDLNDHDVMRFQAIVPMYVVKLLPNVPVINFCGTSALIPVLPVAFTGCAS